MKRWQGNYSPWQGWSSKARAAAADGCQWAPALGRDTSQLVPCHKPALSLTGSAAGQGFCSINIEQCVVKWMTSCLLWWWQHLQLNTRSALQVPWLTGRYSLVVALIASVYWNHSISVLLELWYYIGDVLYRTQSSYFHFIHIDPLLHVVKTGHCGHCLFMATPFQAWAGNTHGLRNMGAGQVVAHHPWGGSWLQPIGRPQCCSVKALGFRCSPLAADKPHKVSTPPFLSWWLLDEIMLEICCSTHKFTHSNHDHQTAITFSKLLFPMLWTNN